MKREDIKKLFESATDEQVKALLDINSGDITFALDKQKTDVEKLKGDLTIANTALTDAKGTITALEQTKGEATTMKAELDKYKAAEEQRKKDEDAAKARKETETRFDTAVGADKKFVHEYVRTGVVGEFEKALADPANKGKSDKEIFETITKDKDYFASQNPPAGGMGSMGGSSGADLIDARAIMGLPPLDKK